MNNKSEPFEPVENRQNKHYFGTIIENWTEIGYCFEKRGDFQKRPK